MMSFCIRKALYEDTSIEKLTRGQRVVILLQVHVHSPFAGRPCLVPCGCSPGWWFGFHGYRRHLNTERIACQTEEYNFLSFFIQRKEIHPNTYTHTHTMTRLCSCSYKDIALTSAWLKYKSVLQGHSGSQKLGFVTLGPVFRYKKTIGPAKLRVYTRNGLQ